MRWIRTGVGGGLRNVERTRCCVTATCQRTGCRWDRCRSSLLRPILTAFWVEEMEVYLVQGITFEMCLVAWTCCCAVSHASSTACRLVGLGFHVCCRRNDNSVLAHGERKSLPTCTGRYTLQAALGGCFIFLSVVPRRSAQQRIFFSNQGRSLPQVTCRLAQVVVVERRGAK